MEETGLNIYQKLAKIRKTVEVVQKNKAGYGYKYVSDDELLAKITGTMDRYGISLIPCVVPGTIKVDPYSYVKTKKGVDENVNEIIVSSDMVLKWINNENPDECVVVPWALVGQQSDASQSFGSGLTYAYRYFLLKYFGVSTPEDDPDAWRSKQKEAEEAENKAIAEQIIHKFDTDVRTYLEEHKDKAEDVKALVVRFVKSGDYTKIKEPTLAQKLSDEFNSKFLQQ